MHIKQIANSVSNDSHYSFLSFCLFKVTVSTHPGVTAHSQVCVM